MTFRVRTLAYSIIVPFGYLTDEMPDYERVIWKAQGSACSMPNVEPNHIEHLKHMLVEYHSHHAREYGPIPACKESVCVEAKLALEYLVEKHSPHTDLRGFQDR